MSKSEKKEKKVKKEKKQAPKSNRELKRERDRRILKGGSAATVSSTKTKALLCIVIAAVALFCGVTAGLASNLHITGPVGENFLSIAGIIKPQQSAAPAEPATQVVATTQAAETTAPASQDSTTAPAGEDTTEPASESAPSSSGELSSSSSKEEIVEYFNNAANKVKTEASKVVRNYEDLQAQNEYLKVPDSLQAIGEFAMNKFLTRNDTPVEYVGADAIKENYPVCTQDYSSKITPDLIDSATVTDNGDTYEITLNFINDQTNINPVYGVGYGTAFNLMLEEQVVLDYPGLSLSNIRIEYHDGVIKATVDKATGRVIASNYSMPMILGLTAKILFSEVDAQIGMKFEHDYTIEY